MIFERALGYIAFKERNPQGYVGLGVTMGQTGSGGAGPVDPTALFIQTRDGTFLLDRAGDNILTRV